MEHVTLKLGKHDEYDRAVHGTPEVPALAQGSGIEVITRDDGTVNGCATAALTWMTVVDGKVVRCQATTTVALLLMAAAGLRGRYDERGRLREHLRKTEAH